MSKWLKKFIQQRNEPDKPDKPHMFYSFLKNIHFDPLDMNSHLYNFEERCAIIEHDGGKIILEAQRIAYEDAAISTLKALPSDNIGEYNENDWLEQRLKSAQVWLSRQGIQRPK